MKPKSKINRKAKFNSELDNCARKDTGTMPYNAFMQKKKTKLIKVVKLTLAIFIMCVKIIARFLGDEGLIAWYAIQYASWLTFFPAASMVGLCFLIQRVFNISFSLIFLSIS